MHDKSKTFCKMPWTNINLTGRGTCKLCHMASDERVLLDWTNTPRIQGWHEDPVERIWNGTYMQDVRQRMLDGREVMDCEPCYKVEQQGHRSRRQEFNDDGFWTMQDPAAIASQLPMSIEIKIGNGCSQQCMYCSSESSSGVLRLHEKALELNANSSLIMPAWLRNNWQGSVNVYRRHQRTTGSDGYLAAPTGLDNMRKLAKTLRRVYITGGEPSEDPSLPDYLDTLIAADNWGCHVSWTTGCTTWNEGLIDRLGFFHNNEIQLSIDGIGSINEYLRRPSIWTDVDSIARRHVADARIKDIKIFTVVSALNAGKLTDLLDWMSDLSITRSIGWVPIMLVNPSQYAIGMLDQHTRYGIRDQLVSWQAANGDRWTNGIDSVCANLTNPAHEGLASKRYQLREALDYFDRLDLALGQDARSWNHNLPHLRGTLA